MCGRPGTFVGVSHRGRGLTWQASYPESTRSALTAVERLARPPGSHETRRIDEESHTTTAHNRHLATESASASAPSSESMTSSMVNCCGNPCSGTGVPGSSRALIAFPVAMPACSAVELPASGCPLMKNSTEASGRESQRQKAAVTCRVPGCDRHYHRPRAVTGPNKVGSM